MRFFKQVPNNVFWILSDDGNRVFYQGFGGAFWKSFDFMDRQDIENIANQRDEINFVSAEPIEHNYIHGGLLP